MRPGSGQRATETPLNPARAPGSRWLCPGRFLRPDRPSSGFPPRRPASAASGARERGDLGPRRPATGRSSGQALPARPFPSTPPCVRGEGPSGSGRRSLRPLAFESPSRVQARSCRGLRVVRAPSPDQGAKPSLRAPTRLEPGLCRPENAREALGPRSHGRAPCCYRCTRAAMRSLAEAGVRGSAPGAGEEPVPPGLRARSGEAGDPACAPTLEAGECLRGFFLFPSFLDWRFGLGSPGARIPHPTALSFTKA